MTGHKLLVRRGASENGRKLRPDGPKSLLDLQLDRLAEETETKARVAWRAQLLERRNEVNPAKARARIRRAGPPLSTLRRWRWALEPLAADPPQVSRWRVGALFACAEIDGYGWIAELTLALYALVTDDWPSALALVGGIHTGVDARLAELIALTADQADDIASEEPATMRMAA